VSDDDTPPMSRPRVAAGALFFDAEGRLLLVKPTYKDGWDIPGGYVEPGETPREACEREVAEELGIRPRIGDLLVADWAPSEAEGDKILFVFDGGQIDHWVAERIVLPAAELSDWRFHNEGDLSATLIPRLARRVLAALNARKARSTTYLEHGIPPRADVTRPAEAH
jgi:8-oxo-dGTP diphosphatase